MSRQELQQYQRIWRRFLCSAAATRLRVRIMHESAFGLTAVSNRSTMAVAEANQVRSATASVRPRLPLHGAGVCVT